MPLLFLSPLKKIVCVFRLLLCRKRKVRERVKRINWGREIEINISQAIFSKNLWCSERWGETQDLRKFSWVVNVFPLYHFEILLILT